MNLTVTAAAGTQVVASATIQSDQTPPLTQVHPTDVVGPVAQAVTVEGEGEAGGGAMGWIELMLGIGGVAGVYGRRLLRATGPLLLATGVAVVLFASPQQAHAAGPGWYLGAGAGQSVGSASAGELDGKLAGLGYNTSSTMDDKGAAGKIFGGYRFTPNWSAEASYVRLGKVTSTIQPNVPPASAVQLVNDVTKVHPYSLSGLTLSGIATLPLPNGFSAFAKLGVIRWDGDVRAKVIPAGAPNASQNFKGTDLTYGLGVGYDFPTNPWGVRLEWERFQTNRNDPYMISASVQFRF
jgi:OOP family OmpA-OmpF porin